MLPAPSGLRQHHSTLTQALLRPGGSWCGCRQAGTAAGADTCCRITTSTPRPLGADRAAHTCAAREAHYAHKTAACGTAGVAQAQQPRCCSALGARRRACGQALPFWLRLCHRGRVDGEPKAWQPLCVCVCMRAPICIAARAQPTIAIRHADPTHARSSAASGARGACCVLQPNISWVARAVHAHGAGLQQHQEADQRAAQAAWMHVCYDGAQQQSEKHRHNLIAWSYL